MPATDAHHLQRQTLARTAHDHPLIGNAMLRHRSTRGQPMSFRSRPFLVELYSDLAHGGATGPRRGSPGGADISSAPQTGKSDLFVQMALHETGWQGRIFAYVLPVQDSRNGFVARRINPHLLEVPAYRARLPGGDLEDLRAGETGNMKSKRFGAGLMLFLGAKTDGDFVEFSADTLVIDEYDLCWMASRKTDGSISNLDKALDRLREGRDPRIFRLGNPEIARGGIEAIVAAGDRRLWHVRCPRCGERQSIDWETHMVERDDAGRWVLRDRAAMLDPDLDPRPVCQRCREPFRREADGAAWVPGSPGADRRSYTISRFDALDQPFRPAWLEWMQAQADSGLQRAWWRGWQGRSWEPSSSQVTREDVIDAAVLAPNDHVGGRGKYSGAMTAGIDVGGLLNVVTSRTVRGAGGRPERRAAWVGACSSFEQVVDVMLRMGVRTAVCDARPEIRKAQELRDELRKHGIDCWLCEFTEAPKADAETFGMRLDRKGRVVKVDRTQLMDGAADCMRAGAALGREYRQMGLTPPPVLSEIRHETRIDVDESISEIDGVPVSKAGSMIDLAEEALRLLVAKIPDPGIDGARLWPVDADSVLGLVDQLRAPRRVMTPRGRIIWDEAGKPDHFRLADAYDLLAMHLDGRGGDFF